MELKDANAAMIFDLTAKKQISHDPEKSSENLLQSFVDFIKGLISFALNIPRTAYHKCLQGRKKAMAILENMLEERRRRPNKLQSDFYDYVLEELQKKDIVLTETYDENPVSPKALNPRNPERASGTKTGLKMIKSSVATARPIRVPIRVIPAKKSRVPLTGRRVTTARTWEVEGVFLGRRDLTPAE
ncbi:hypothetical protein AgCh_019694 [Apium graveolens]